MGNRVSLLWGEAQMDACYLKQKPSERTPFYRACGIVTDKILQGPDFNHELIPPGKVCGIPSFVMFAWYQIYSNCRKSSYLLYCRRRMQTSLFALLVVSIYR